MLFLGMAQLLQQLPVLQLVLSSCRLHTKPSSHRYPSNWVKLVENAWEACIYTGATVMFWTKAISWHLCVFAKWHRRMLSGIHAGPP